MGQEIVANRNWTIKVARMVRGGVGWGYIHQLGTDYDLSRSRTRTTCKAISILPIKTRTV
jgi:hypothetical protein